MTLPYYYLEFLECTPTRTNHYEGDIQIVLNLFSGHLFKSRIKVTDALKCKNSTTSSINNTYCKTFKVEIALFEYTTKKQILFKFST